MSPSTKRQTLQRLKRGIRIRRPKRGIFRTEPASWHRGVARLMARYDAGAYSILQFLRAICHSLGIHIAGFLAEVSDDDNDGVNVDEQQEQHSGPITSVTAAADATSARSATNVTASLSVIFQSVIFRSCICIRPTQTIQRRSKLDWIRSRSESCLVNDKPFYRVSCNQSSLAAISSQ